METKNSNPDKSDACQQYLVSEGNGSRIHIELANQIPLCGDTHSYERIGDPDFDDRKPCVLCFGGRE